MTEEKSTLTDEELNSIHLDVMNMLRSSLDDPEEVLQHKSDVLANRIANAAEKEAQAAEKEAQAAEKESKASEIVAEMSVREKELEAERQLLVKKRSELDKQRLDNMRLSAEIEKIKTTITQIQEEANHEREWVQRVLPYRPSTETLDRAKAETVAEKVEMNTRHANIAADMIGYGVAWLIDHIDSLRPETAIKLIVEGVKIEKESRGIASALAKISKMGDDDLDDTISKLLAEVNMQQEQNDGVIPSTYEVVDDSADR